MCLVWMCGISSAFFVGGGINHPLSQQVKMDKIAKNMIPNANSAERNPKAQCDIHKEKYGLCVYFDTQMLPPMAHTFTKTLHVYNLRDFVFCDGKKKDER